MMNLLYCGSDLPYILLKIQIRIHDVRNVGILHYLSLEYFGKFICNFGRMVSYYYEYVN
jgi:hypothetical protein